MRIQFIKTPAYNVESDKVTVEMTNDDISSLDEFVDLFLTFASASGWRLEHLAEAIVEKVPPMIAEGLY